MFALVDSVNYYTSNLEIYAGKQPEGPFSFDNSTKTISMRLIQSIFNTGRNVTMDNWFTSVNLGDDLIKKKKYSKKK